MKHVNQLLPDFITGTLSEVEQADVIKHLARCSVCAAEYDEMRQTFSLLKESSIVEPNRTYFPNLLPSIRQRQNEKVFFWHLLGGKTTRLMLPLSAVAMLVILFIFTLPRENNFVEPSALRAVITNMQSEEVNDVAVEQDKTALVEDTHELASTIVDEHLTKNHVMKEALRSDAGTEIINDVELEKTVDEFDGDQIDQLLAQLGERKNL